MLQNVIIEGEEGEKPTRVVVNDQEYSLIDRYEGVQSPTGGFGTTRWVFIGDNYVVKVKGRNNEYNAMGDVGLFIEPQDQKHFARIVYVDINKQWFVQERVNCIPNIEPSEEDRGLIREISEQYGIVDIAGFYCGAPHNWTVDVNGTPVIYDYDF